MSEENLNIEDGVLKKYDGKDRAIVIPSFVTKIGEGAFRDSTIETIRFEGTGLKSVEREAFYGCTNLQNIRLPKGVVNIGDRAFYGCKSMIYIEIPESVLIVGEDILGECEKIKFVTGEKGSEAENIASQHKLVLNDNADEAIKGLKNISTAKQMNQTKSFELWGETITCSNTLGKYAHNLSYYAKRKEGLYQRFFSKFPQSLSDQFGDLVSVLHEEQDNTISRLSQQGVYIDREAFAEYLGKPYTAILEASTAIKNVYTYVSEGVESGITTKREALLNEAESKITGLSYGVIGGGLDMLTYAVDDYRARKEQREEAYEYAEKKAAEFKEIHTKNGNDLYASLIALAAPALHMATDMFLDALCQAENDQLIKAGLIDKETMSRIDPAKSNQLLDSIVDKPGEHSFTIALALKKYPCNISVFAYALQNGYASDELKKLIRFLGVRSEVDQVIEMQKREAHRALIEKIGREIESNNINDGIAIIQRYEKTLEAYEVKEFLRTLSKRAGLEIEKVVYDLKTIQSEQLERCCKLGLYNTITDESWKYCEVNGIQPVTSNLIPTKYQQSRERVLEWMVAVSTELSKHPELPGKFEAEEKLNQLRNSDAVDLDMWIGIIICIVIAIIALLNFQIIVAMILFVLSFFVGKITPQNTRVGKLEQDLNKIAEITNSIGKMDV